MESLQCRRPRKEKKLVLVVDRFAKPVDDSRKKEKTPDLLNGLHEKENMSRKRNRSRRSFKDETSVSDKMILKN